MRVPPTYVSDADVAQCVAAGWDVRVDEIAYAPVGFGSHHWHVTAGEDRLFVTVDVVRDPADLAAAFGTAAGLHRQHLSFVHAPLPARDGRLLHTVAADHPLVVHRWLDGVALSERAREHAPEIIQLLAELHAVPPDSVPARRADLAIQGREGFAAAVRRIDTPWPGPYGERARTVLREQWDRLDALFTAHDRESAEMLVAQEDWVVTHGEPHGGNLVRGADGLHLIDWDTALIAPAARDVWQVGGATDADRYRELTGRVLHQEHLAHFRRDWDLAEVCLYAADFAAPHEETADTAIMWEGFNESLERLGS